MGARGALVKAENIARMATDAVAFDTETHLIQPGLLAPPMVCGSLARAATGRGVLLSKDDTFETFCALLESKAIIVGANIAYDMLVMAVEGERRGVDLMPAIFDAYEDDRVFDVQIAEKLHAIAEGTLGKDPRKLMRGMEPKLCGLRDPLTGKDAHYSLSVVTDLVLGRADAKANDTWRLRYALLEEVPLDEWPFEARQYPVDDAVNTLEVGLAQAGHRPNVGVHHWRSGKCVTCGARFSSDYSTCTSSYPRRNLHDLAAQVYASFALHLGAAWGLRTDKAKIDVLEMAAKIGQARGLELFKAEGFIRDDGSEDASTVKRAVAIAYGATEVCEVCAGSGKVHKKFSAKDPTRPVGAPVQCKRCCASGFIVTNEEGKAITDVPVNDPTLTNPFGSIKTGRDALVESGDEKLMAYAEHSESDKINSTYVPALRRGESGPWNLRPNNPLETGRVSYSGPEQTFPRQVSAHLAEELKKLAEQGYVRVHGVRDCVVPRPGWVFYSNDYTGGELVTFSEAAVERVGWSDMGVSLNAGRCVHSELGAEMLGISYDEMMRRRKAKSTPEGKRANDFRQGAKPPNFGYPGGMGPVKLVLQQRAGGPDTPCPGGPSQVWDGKKFVAGYKGTRFCILIGGKERCGEVKVTSWGERPCPPTCLACIEVSARLRSDWKTKWSEADPYLRWHANNVEERGEVRQLYTGRIRGGTDFCSESNGDFQALLADIAKRALARVVKEQYTRVIVDSRPHADFIVERVTRAELAKESRAWLAANPKALESRYEGCPSPLFGTRNVEFLHDENLGEAPESQAPDASERVNEIMVEEFRKGCPHHVPACKAEPTLMPALFKGAEPVFRDRAGNLVERHHPEAKVALWRPAA